MTGLSSNSKMKKHNKHNLVIYHQVKPGTDCSDGIASAEFYEVKVETIQKVSKRYRDEFTQDGLRVLRSKDLKVVMDSLSITDEEKNQIRNLTVWTQPCGNAFRLFTQGFRGSQALKNNCTRCCGDSS